MTARQWCPPGYTPAEMVWMRATVAMMRVAPKRFPGSGRQRKAAGAHACGLYRPSGGTEDPSLYRPGQRPNSARAKRVAVGGVKHGSVRG